MNHHPLYQTVLKKLKPQLKRTRDRDVRIRAELILLGLKLNDIAEACRRSGFGRTMFYSWFRRLKADDFNIRALRARTSRPKRSPGKIEGFLETRIWFYRRKGFGPDIIREYLRREGRVVARSTIAHVINKRQKPAKKRRHVLKKHRRRYELPLPGERLQLDVKYSPMKVEGRTVFIYNIVDECTRWRYSHAYPEVNAQWTVKFLEQMMKHVPFPIYTIQTDNGQEFTWRLLSLNGDKTHPMDAWCKANAVRHRCIPPGVKELNGKVERSHRIDADYFYGRAPTWSLEAFNAAMKRWIGRYNTERPHQGIGWMTPMEKLEERISTLKGEVWDKDKEPARLKFLEDTPMMLTEDGRRYTTAAKRIKRLEFSCAS